MTHEISTLFRHVDSPVVGGTLLAAGMIPSIFDLQHLQSVYFCLLIPPAAYHCYAWFKKSILPTLEKWFKRD